MFGGFTTVTFMVRQKVRLFDTCAVLRMKMPSNHSFILCLPRFKLQKSTFSGKAYTGKKRDKNY